MASWTIHRASADTRKVYCSASTGDDQNDGRSYLKAVKTLAWAKIHLRSGYPDWLLLHRGDVWDEPLGHWTKSGRSAAEPMLIGTYGAALERPMLRTGTDEGLFTQPGGGSSPTIANLSVVGLDFQGTGDNGLRFLVPGENVLVEDCLVSGYRVNVLFQGYEGWLRNFKLRRSIIVDSTPGTQGGHSQGLYAYAVDGLQIEQCVFDNNGKPATIHNHSVYLDNGNTGCVVNGNIFSRPGSHGIQMRSGGVAFNNLFVRCPIALQLGGGNAPESGGVEFDARGNCVVEGANIDADNPRGWGVLMQNIRSGRFESNLIVHSAVGAQPVALSMDGTHSGEDGVIDFGVHNVAFKRNVVVAWRGGVEVHGDVTGYTQEGDNFGIQFNTTVKRTFPDPRRTVPANFVEMARGQSRKNWRPELTAHYINKWMRNGFNMAEPSR